MSRGRGRGRERGEAVSPPSREPYTGLNLRTPRSWPEPKPRVGGSTNWAAQATPDDALVTQCNHDYVGKIADKIWSFSVPKRNSETF